MNGDEIAALVRQVATGILSSGAAAAYVSGSQATAIASGLGAIAAIVWGVYSRWNMRKVPETAIVTATASDVTTAKALSTVKGAM